MFSITKSSGKVSEMKKSIRFLTLVLALLLCATVFASCADKTPTESTTVAQTEDPDPYAKRFAKADYNGDTFMIYARESTSYSHKGIYANEQNGDYINDETLKRNQAVEAKYNIKFAIKTREDPYNTVTKEVKSDIVDYDLILDRRNVLASLITSGLLYNWNALDIDMDVSWWDSNCKKGYDLVGKNYFAVNDVSIRNLADARFLYFNKEIVEDYALENPYDLVDKNQWTLDKYCELVKAVSNPGADKNTLGVYGMLREDNQYNGNHMFMITACGISYLRYEDDNLVCNIDGSNLLKLQDIVDKLSAVYTSDYSKTYDEVDQIDKSTGYENMFEKGRGNFASGHFLFVQNGMGEAETFQDMPKGFGVVPNPKYSTDQENYYHKVDVSSLIWAIPNIQSVDKERIANVTDYWAYVSSTTVMAVFYEVVTKSKNVDEITAGKNLDIIKNSVAYELGDIFDYGISNNVDQGYHAGNVARYFTSAQIRNFNRQIDRLNQEIYELD